MKATNLLKSKRGVAIENAILFLLVVFALCSLLTMIALIANYQFKIDKIVLEQDVDLDQVGEEFVAAIITANGDLGNVSLSIPGYNHYYSHNGDVGTLYVTSGNGEKLVDKPITALLYVEAKSDGTILSWRYSAPTPPEP